jgi:subtilisin-like proprotein convertase family protein
MRLTPRTRMVLSLVLFAGALFFWIKGNDQLQQPRMGRAALVPVSSKLSLGANTANNKKPGNAMPSSLLSAPGVQAAINQSLSGITVRKSGAPASPAGFTDARFRISNSSKSLEEWVRDEGAILLRNALIDTSAGIPQIPRNLQNQGESYSYIVQAKSAPDARFRAELAAANASIVSYVPNNAYLVEATPEAVKQLRVSTTVRSVLPYEPYYKLSQRLLELAVTESDLPGGAILRVTLFPGQKENGIQALQQLGIAMVGEESSPFGPQILVEPPSDVLPALARVGAVQGIEPEYRRKPASDLTRVQIGLAEDTITNANYLDLTGSNIWVNINDTGIDAAHGDLKGRVFSPFVNLLKDTNGHGTFVAGILAGDGKRSSSVNGTNGFVSATNADYRGMAPLAKLFELPLDFFPEVNVRQSDAYLQETAASTNYVTLKRTNSLISNNSWVYDGAIDYDSAAARYDAAVRDALPGLKGEQEIAYVFPAGNNGFGNDDGTAGEPGLISSPGTAKNVITVGALEHARFITNFFTNIVTTADEKGSNIFVTNQITPYLAATDSSNEVASFSSRGNVGIGIEGTFGRFKPDVVAPGSFMIAARSTNWNGSFDTNTPEGAILSTLNTNLGAYRLDSGTTYAVPVVSGMMALFQEFFETKAKEKRSHLSPALMKALVINGARSANSIYDVSPRTLLNAQGWGLVNIQRSLPELLQQTNALNGPIQLIDQSPTNALSTGKARTWAVSLNTNGIGFPLRATLVWSDPPGNPNVGVKLVNDLDLVITNLESGYVFYGNDIESGTDFTTPTAPNVEGLADSVNNVENVFIQNPRAFGTNFTITVRARKVNVNAIPDYQAAGGTGSDIVQDFALVIASDNIVGTNAFNSFAITNSIALNGLEPLTRITNGLPLLNQRVGANPVLLGAGGAASQWRFYTFTNVAITNEFNSLTNGSNVAFVTFAPPNLSISRTLEADIDLYVSKDPGLTNLNPAALASAFKSTNEGGTEFITFTNAVVSADEVYYIGVKSEDQQAAEFSLMGVSSDQPFQREENGRIILQGYPISQVIPDGSARLPGGTVILALGLDPRRIATVEASELIAHEDLGDLIGNLSHGHSFAVLNNHTRNEGHFNGANLLVYNDLLTTTIYPPATNGIQPRVGPSDGPGTLNNFVGKPLLGPWFLTMVDNSPALTGRVENLQIALTPLHDLKDGIAIGSVAAGESVSYAVDVPAGATNMVVTLTQKTGPPLQLLLGLDGVPFVTNAASYQVVGKAVAGVGTGLQYGITNSPPLQPGATYYLTVYNASVASISYELQVRFEIDFNPGNHNQIITTNLVAVLNDARTNSNFTVKDDRLVADLSVGVRIDYPRVSDLLLTLTSPQGTRVVLAENRGGASASSYGTTFPTNRIAYTYFTEDTNFATSPIKFAAPPFFDAGATNGIILSDNFDQIPARLYSNEQVGGWTVGSSEVEVVMNPAIASSSTQYVSLRAGSISTNLNTVIGREYQMDFVSRSSGCVPVPAGVVGWWTGDNNPNDISGFKNNAVATGVAYTSGKVASGFNFGGGSSVIAPSSPSLRAVNLTFDAWVFPTETTLLPVVEYGDSNQKAGAHFWVGSGAGFGLPGSLYANFRDVDDQDHVIVVDNVIPANQWSFIAVTYDQDSGIGRLYLNGEEIGEEFWDFFIPLTSKHLNIGYRPVTSLSGSAGARFKGTIDEVEIFNRALAADELKTLFMAGSAGKCKGNVVASMGVVEIGTKTNTFSATPAWQTNSIHFIATSTVTPIRFAGIDDGVWIDTVQVEETGARSYWPEESLERFKGERTFGDWRLDVYDTRSNQFVNGSLISWYLNLDYATPAQAAFVLNSGAAAQYVGTIKTNQVNYFVVEPCDNTTEITVILTGAPTGSLLLLSADRSGFPTGNALTDDYVPLLNEEKGNVAVLHLTTNSPAPAPLIPGQPIYLTVQNLQADATNTFMITARFSPTPKCILETSIRLQSSSSFASAFAATGEGEADSFILDPTTESNTKLSVSGRSGANLGILVKQGAVPTPLDFDYKRDLNGEAGESIVLHGLNSSSGPWYALIYNNSDFAAPYTLIRSDDSNLEFTDIVVTLNGVNMSFVSVPGSSYMLQSSTDLKHWDDLQQVTAFSKLTLVSDPAVPVGDRFYRIVKTAD